MSNENKYEIRVMTIDDYDEVYSLWQTIHGFGIRSIDDSREGVLRFLKRNPTTSVVAVEDGKIVGAILCGHDGRRGCLYHVCVQEAYQEVRHRKEHGGCLHESTSGRAYQQGVNHSLQGE